VVSNVTAIAAGGLHSLFLKNDGSLWAMGDNIFGELGDGTYIPTDRPEQIVASNVTAVAAGVLQSLFLKSDGSLWGMGAGGELGDGSNKNTNRPVQIVASNVTAFATGGHSLFLKSDGSLWAMGDDQYGELGDGTYNNTNLPEQIVAGPPGYGYNQVSIQLLSGGGVCSYFGGMAGTNYALDRSFSLSPANWVPQVTNPAGAWGVVVFTNTPDPTTNNFWRIRSVP
jgi:alpha-tubulin suppressor-like RCC1 family protein